MEHESVTLLTWKNILLVCIKVLSMFPHLLAPDSPYLDYFGAPSAQKAHLSAGEIQESGLIYDQMSKTQNLSGKPERNGLAWKSLRKDPTALFKYIKDCGKDDEDVALHIHWQQYKK